MVRVEGKIYMEPISILIDLGSTHSCVTRKIIEGCGLKRKNHFKSWLVQLDTGSKRKVSEVVKE